MFLLLCLLGCPRSIPDHLKLATSSAPATGVQEVTLTTEEAALTVLLRGDPLVRDPNLRAPALLHATGTLQVATEAASFADTVQAIERRQGDAATALQQVEDAHAGPLAGVLSRGYRLHLVDALLPRLDSKDVELEHSILTLLTPLQSADAPESTRRPLYWLGSPSQVRSVADRWVLEAWLSDANLPLTPVASALDASRFDVLRTTPIAALIRARAEGAQADTTSGQEALQQATLLALQRAAADRDSEQARWAKHRASLKDLLGDHPIDALLARAVKRLTAGASTPKATGGALLAIAAQRWTRSCPDTPCVGLDRTTLMVQAAAWDPEVARLAEIWQVIALKEAVDTLDVGHDTVMYRRAMVEISDALLGTGAGPLPSHLLRYDTPNAAAWLALGRAVDSDGTTDWVRTRTALGVHLQRLTNEVGVRSAYPEHKSYLNSIATRAVP